MRVLFAYYGVSCAKGHLRKNVEKLSTNYAKRRCNGRSRCSGIVSNRNLGNNPYGYCHKDFIVVAKCSSGKIIYDAVKAVGGEGQRFSLSCYQHYYRHYWQ